MLVQDIALRPSQFVEALIRLADVRSPFVLDLVHNKYADAGLQGLRLIDRPLHLLQGQVDDGKPRLQCAALGRHRSRG